MKLALRWKITLAFSLVTVAVLGLLYAYLHVAVRASETRQLTESLLAQARLVNDHLPSLSSPAPDLRGWAQAQDAHLNVRFTIIGGDGVVVTDSREDPAVMENHADRPERLQALASGCLLYTSPSPRDRTRSRMPSSA